MPVNSFHPEYCEHIEDWEDCRNFYAGEKKVKALGDRYLPKPEGASTQEYKSYKMRAGFFPAVERTVAGLTGAIDRKSPTFELPSKMEYLEKDVDITGTSLRQFSKQVLNEVTGIGRCGILVDRKQDGSDPYLALYQAESIINWDVDDDKRLTLVVLEEWYYERQPGIDFFTKQKKCRFRVLYLDDAGDYVQDIYEVRTVLRGKNKGTYSVPSEPTRTIKPTKEGIGLKEIPFVFINAESIKPDICKPPLLDLVRKNAEHYRVSADYANGLYFTGNPILVVSGEKATKRRPHSKNPRGENLLGESTVNAGFDYPPDYPDYEISLGSTRAMYIGKESKMYMVECSGHGIAPNRDRSNDIKIEMAVLGARLLEGQRTGVEAAETATIRQSGETSTLSGIVTTVSTGMEKALYFVSLWLNVSGKIEFALNTDFIEVSMNPQLLAQLMLAVKQELISWDTFFYNLAIGELMVPGRTPEEEKEKIAEGTPMGTPTDPNDTSGLNDNGAPVQTSGMKEGETEEIQENQE